MANKKGQNNSRKERRAPFQIASCHSNKEFGTGQEGSERRAVPRIKREVIVRYRIKELPHLGNVQVSLKPSLDITRTKDLSEKGLFFTASQAISPRSILEIELQLPSQEQLIGLEANVVSSEEIRKNLIYGIRAEFINLTDEQKETLRNFVQLFLKNKRK